MKKGKLTTREIKSAKLKLLLLSNLKEALRHQRFNEIHVKDLCRASSISKVTFFRYFPQKEDLLIYFFRIWAFETEVKIMNESLSGLRAIRYIFEKLGDFVEDNPSAVFNVIKYYASSDTIIKPIPIKPAEKVELYPHLQIDNLPDALSFEKLLEKYLLDAIFKTEITGTSDVGDLVRMLLSTTYGTILVSKMKQLNFKATIKQSVENSLTPFRA